MPGQFVAQVENLSLPINVVSPIIDTMFYIGFTQQVSIEFTIVNAIYRTNSQNATIVVPFTLRMLGPNNADPPSTSLTIGRTPTTVQFFHPTGTNILSLTPGHYVVAVTASGPNFGNTVDTIEIRKAILAISARV